MQCPPGECPCDTDSTRGPPLAGESDAVVVARERESHPTSPDETQGEALDRTGLLLTYLLRLKDQGHAWHSAPDKPVCQGVVVAHSRSRLGRSMADPVLIPRWKVRSKTLPRPGWQSAEVSVRGQRHLCPGDPYRVLSPPVVRCNPASDALSSRTWWGRVGPPLPRLIPTGELGAWWGPSASPPKPQTGSALGKATLGTQAHWPGWQAQGEW